VFRSVNDGLLIGTGSSSVTPPAAATRLGVGVEIRSDSTVTVVPQIKFNSHFGCACSDNFR
jgi:hypothetical protein